MVVVVVAAAVRVLLFVVPSARRAIALDPAHAVATENYVLAANHPPARLFDQVRTSL